MHHSGGLRTYSKKFLVELKNWKNNARFSNIINISFFSILSQQFFTNLRAECAHLGTSRNVCTHWLNKLEWQALSNIFG
jgi:hypothetical protein